MIYLGVFIVIFSCSLLIKNKSEEYKNKFFRITVIFLTILSGLRFEVGHDFESYYKIHSSSSWHLGKHDFIEPGYTLISKMCYIIFPDKELSFQLLIFIFTAATMYLYYKVIDKYSKNKMLSLAILFPMYYLNTVFGQIRYGIVLAICIYSYQFIKAKELKKFLLLMLIAFSFHFSAVFFVPVYFLANIEIKDIWKVVITIFSLIFGVIINPVNIIEIINDNIIHSGYITSKVALYSSTKISIFSSSFIYIILIYIFMLFIYKAFKEKDNNFELMLNIMFWGIIFYILTNRFEIIAFRASSYYFILEILLIPNVLSFIRDKYNLLKKVFVSFIVFYSSYRFYITVVYWIGIFVPYRNYIFHIISDFLFK